MKKMMIFLTIFCLVFLSVETYPAAMKDLSGFKGRAVSLKVLQQKLKQCRKKGSMPTTLYNLCGLKKISGYVADEANKDVLLIGEVDTTSPDLHLNDFVVALRNAFGKYTKKKGNNLYYEAPGCSIEPAPETIRKLNKIKAQLSEAESPEEIEATIKKWQDACASPQQVLVFGVPFHSRFARVMVKADYDLKQVADGSDKLNLAFFSSVTDIILSEIGSSMRKGRFLAFPGTFNRFWFAPGKNLYSETDGAVFIQECGVKLLTREQHLVANKKVADKGNANPHAEQFADDFTNYFQDISVQRHIYRELENLYRFVALAKILKYKAPHEKVGLSLDYLLKKYLPSDDEKEKVKKTLLGRSHVARDVKQLRTAEGTRPIKYWIPSCGGVNMDIDAKPQNFEKDTKRKLENLKASATKKMALDNKLFSNVDGNEKEVHFLIKRKIRSTTKRHLDCTIGEIYVNGEYLGNTLELPFKNNENYKSSVTVGQYNAELQYSNKKKQWRINLEDKKSGVYKYDKKAGMLKMKQVTRAGIQIHIGNDPNDTTGCILIGDSGGPSPYRVYNSTKTFNKMLEKYFGSNQYPDQSKKITVTIQTDY